MSLVTVKLGGYVDLVMGQAPPGEACNKEGEGTIFVKAGEFQERSPAIREWTTQPLKFAKNNDTLVCVVGATSGKVNLATFECAIGRSVAAVRPIPGKIDPLFLYYFLQTTVGQLRDRAQGAAQGVITREMLQSLTLVLPPLPEQRRIAAILDQADALKVKRREALAELDKLIQAIFIEMFGDPVRNSLGWPYVSLSQLLVDAEVFVDGDWVESKDQDPNGDVRLIQLADIGDGRFIDKSARFLTKKTAENLKCTYLKEGDILVARMPDPLGRACLFPGGVEQSVTVVDVCIIRPAKNGVNPYWLMCCINSQAFRQKIAGEATGSTRTRISRGNLSKLKLIAPPINLQEEFAKKYIAVLALRDKYVASLEENDSLFLSLQHRAFQGDL